MELLLSTKRVNISISATDDTVQTPMRYSCIDIFTNSIKPLTNSSISYSGCWHCFPSSFLPSLSTLAKTQKVSWELYLKVRAAGDCWTPCSTSAFLSCRTIPALQASTFLTHLLRLLIPNDQQHCSREDYPLGERRHVWFASTATSFQLQQKETCGDSWESLHRHCRVLGGGTDVARAVDTAVEHGLQVMNSAIRLGHSYVGSATHTVPVGLLLLQYYFTAHHWVF